MWSIVNSYLTNLIGLVAWCLSFYLFYIYRLYIQYFIHNTRRVPLLRCGVRRGSDSSASAVEWQDRVRISARHPRGGPSGNNEEIKSDYKFYIDIKLFSANICKNWRLCGFVYSLILNRHRRTVFTLFSFIYWNVNFKFFCNWTFLYLTVQYRQCSTVQYSAVQCKTVQ